MLSSYLKVEHPFLLLREVAEGGRDAEVQQVGVVGEEGGGGGLVGGGAGGRKEGEGEVGEVCGLLVQTELQIQALLKRGKHGRRTKIALERRELSYFFIFHLVLFIILLI